MRALVLCTLLLASPAQADGFVSVSGTRFVRDGATLRFTGANVSVMHGARERAALEETLDAVARDGGRVIRVWALGEAPPGSPAWRRDYAFRFGPDELVEASYAHLDRVLEAARARGLLVIVVLANRWRDYGGFPEYLRWVEPSVVLEANGDVPRAALGRFYTSSAASALYQAHVRSVVTRTTARTGVPYRDDTTIFAWELANETAAHTDEDEAALVAWTRTHAAFVKGLDPNHLVAAGHIGYDTERERATWLAVQSLPEIDYADAHVYPLGDPRVTTRAHLTRYVEDRVALAHSVVRKPFVFGEFGFDGDAEALRGRARTAWTHDLLEDVARLGAAGALVWFYHPPGDAPRMHAVPATVAEEDAAIRATLRAFAPRMAVDVMPALTAQGLAPIFTERVVLRGARVHGFVPEGGAHTLAADALDFAEARFERAGVYPGPPIAHLWGVGAGFVTYRFRAPSVTPGQLVIRLHLSSELDGRGLGARPSDTSEVQVAIDDVDVGSVVAPVDDGAGRPVTIVVDDDALLDRIFAARGRVHALVLSTRSRPGAGGLCVYGAVSAEATSVVPDAVERATALRMTWTPR